MWAVDGGGHVNAKVKVKVKVKVNETVGSCLHMLK
jgi:hypothetical protein